MKRPALTALALLSFARVAHATQVVVAEAEYTHSTQTTQDSHYRVPPTAETPPDWTQPIDYANGSVHVRLEVKTKPSDTPTRYQICFEMKQNYCCTDQAPSYTTPGVYEWDTPVAKLWRPGPVNFAQGIVQSALILKDTNNVKPAPENVGEATSNLYMPTDLRVVVTLVSAGDVYSSGEPEPAAGGSGSGGGSGGGGETVAGAGSGGGSASAGPSSSTGGSGGTGGASSTAASTAGAGGMAEMVGLTTPEPAVPERSTPSCSVGVPDRDRSAAWLLAGLLLAARRRTPNG